MAPDVKARSSAFARPPRAASAVRTLARTDTFMPAYPATPESTAPITKPTATGQPRKISSSATGTPTMAIVRYWRLRYAAAPSWIACAISCILAFPAGAASTRRLAMKP